MRTEREMYDLILEVARGDERVRAVILNGSRANPNAPSDFFQDYDIVYVVTDVASYLSDPDWIKCFGEMMILQLPDDMEDSEPGPTRTKYAYLMQFMDGTRIDLTVYHTSRLTDILADSDRVLLLDKDEVIGPLAPASDSDYLVKPPTQKQFDDCCNEFWWVSPYAAKGLWRGEIVYAKAMLDENLREQLNKMLNWYIGVRTEFQVNPGKNGKYFQKYLEEDKWAMLVKTYADADYAHTWAELFAMGELFRATAIPVAQRFGYAYPRGEDERVTRHLQHVHELPRDAKEMY